MSMRSSFSQVKVENEIIFATAVANPARLFDMLSRFWDDLRTGCYLYAVRNANLISPILYAL